MKILADAGPIYSGQLTGVGYFTDELLKHLSVLAELNGYAFNFRGKKAINLNFPVQEQKLLPGKALTYPRYLGIDLPLSLFFKTKGYDVVISSNYLIPPCGRTPTIPVVHDLGFVDHPEWVQSRNAFILRKMLPKTLERSKALITISEFSAERIRAVYNYKKPILVVDIPPKKSSQGSSKPRGHNLKSGKYFLFVGTIEPRKNIQTLLDAFEALPTELQSAYPLVLAGKPGWDLAVLARLRSSKNKNVIYLDYVTESERNWLYQNTVATVIPSHYEGFGMTVLESLDAGSPTITSDIPSHREILGVTGEYFDCLDIDKLTCVLSSFTKSNQRDRMLVKQSKVLSKYNWKSTTTGVLDFIKSIVDNDSSTD